MLPIAVSLGDPAGIGPEVVFRSLEGFDHPVRLFGSLSLSSPPAAVDFVDVGGLGSIRYGVSAADYGQVALDSIDAAVAAVERGECSALVTAPISKKAIQMAGCPFPGHTELLAARAGLSRYAHDYAMYFDSPTLRVALLTVHTSLKSSLAAIRADDISALASLVSREFERLHGQRPRIGVAGVNPHAGEDGQFGTEETEIARGVELARAAGLEVDGPLPADTIFLSARRGRFDAILAMYHDQGLIPVKTLHFDESVNVTLGLPYLRVSVDHGTAFDIAGKGVADPAPMRYALRWAAEHADGPAGR